jgi:superfamily I DNA/RNA helicase
VRKFAIKIFQEDLVDDLDGGSDSNKGYKSIFHGPEPEIIKAKDLYDEVEKIAERISLIRKNDSEAQVCVALRTNKLVENYQELLNKKSIETVTLKSDHSDDPASKAIRLATMHRVKGLEFDHMIIAGAIQGVVPLQQVTQSDEALIAKENITKERCLLFVDNNRLRQNVRVCGRLICIRNNHAVY